ncbi:MAG: hypothetical protein M1298_02650 [Chloroflexi bacterium]|nr:hypothetical protein [Chloroflexota bacterium]
MQLLTASRLTLVLWLGVNGLLKLGDLRGFRTITTGTVVTVTLIIIHPTARRSQRVYSCVPPGRSDQVFLTLL